ncbi:MAG: hypothetical protein OHK0029_23150 [Armatimonadaceae bacterium]
MHQGNREDFGVAKGGVLVARGAPVTLVRMAFEVIVNEAEDDKELARYTVHGWVGSLSI